MLLPLVRPVQRSCGTAGQDGNIAAHPAQPGAAGIWREVLRFSFYIFSDTTCAKMKKFTLFGTSFLGYGIKLGNGILVWF